MAKQYYHQNIKERAKELRKLGLSYREIAVRLGVSKSSVKLWTHAVHLTPEQRERLYNKAITALANSPNNSRERRKREIEVILAGAEKEVNLPISDDTLKLLGAMLYWAEGDKRKNFSVSNSDPLLISFMICWMKRVFGITESSLKAHLNIYPQQDEKELKKFWSDLTGVPLQNFGKSFIKPLSKGFKKNALYYGTIKIRMAKGGDALHRVFGWIRVLLKDFRIKVEKIETKWNKLKTDRNFA